MCNNSQAAIPPSCSFSPKQHVAEKTVNSKTVSLENIMQEKKYCFLCFKNWAHNIHETHVEEYSEVQYSLLGPTVRNSSSSWLLKTWLISPPS